MLNLLTLLLAVGTIWMAWTADAAHRLETEPCLSVEDVKFLYSVKKDGSKRDFFQLELSLKNPGKVPVAYTVEEFSLEGNWFGEDPGAGYTNLGDIAFPGATRTFKCARHLPQRPPELGDEVRGSLRVRFAREPRTYRVARLLRREQVSLMFEGSFRLWIVEIQSDIGPKRDRVWQWDGRPSIRRANWRGA